MTYLGVVLVVLGVVLWLTVAPGIGGALIILGVVLVLLGVLLGARARGGGPGAGL